MDERALTSHVLGRAVLEAAVRVLDPLGIALMPLKGLWLQQLVYGDAGGRVITDVDVLVQEHQYTAARRALEAAGFRLWSANVAEAAYQAPGLPLPLDLHRSLFTRAAFHLPAADLFARGQLDRSTFGVPVVMPDPADVLAHLVGHALKGGTAWSGEGHELRDIPRLLAACARAPEVWAHRLVRAGLARAARLVLPLVAADDPGQLADSVLRSLPPDRLGELLVWLVARARALSRQDGVPPSWPSFLLDASLPRAAAAVALRLWDKPGESRRHARP